MNEDSICVWGFNIPHSWLEPEDLEYLNGLPDLLPTVDWVWTEMDRVWQQLGLDGTQPLTEQSVGAFYGHPVWLMNGIFTALDPVSASHRKAIASYIRRSGARSVADYGGGFGELAGRIARISPETDVAIIEPYPSRVAQERLRSNSHIRFVPGLADGEYDVIVAQDVLEHVEDPIGLTGKLAAAVRDDGLVILANNFHPVIQCHLPSTFHLRHTFVAVTRALGLRHEGTVANAEHAHVFRRKGPLNLPRARRAETICRLLGPWINEGRRVASDAKKGVLR